MRLVETVKGGVIPVENVDYLQPVPHNYGATEYFVVFKSGNRKAISPGDYIKIKEALEAHVPA